MSFGFGNASPHRLGLLASLLGGGAGLNPDYANVKLLCNMDTGASGDVYDSVSASVMTSGFGLCSTAVTLFGNSTLPTTTNTVSKLSSTYLPTTSYVLEGWVYVPSTPAGNFNGVAGFRLEAAAQPAVYVNSDLTLNLYLSGTHAGAALSLATWHHYAVVASGTDVRLYIDGTLVQTVVAGLFTGPTSPDFLIGRNSTLNTNSTSLRHGPIRYTVDDLYITGDFDVPTAVFPTS